MTDRYYLIGEDVFASPSPAMFNAAFRYFELDAEYYALSVPRERLRDEFLSLKEKGTKGMNVTIPFKTALIPLLDVLDELSGKIHAVNTIKSSGGNYIGYNTDVYGITRALENHGKTTSERALLIGAGGAARAFCGAADHLGFRAMTVAVRDMGRASDFIEDMEDAFPNAQFNLCELGSLRDRDFDLVFNASPIGSKGIPLPSYVRQVLRPGMLVFDAVYNPVETELLAAAARAGCKTVKGYEMLLGQALSAFETWTGRRPPPRVMERDMLDLIRRYIR
jgi:shikimate dehydrogenase